MESLQWFGRMQSKCQATLRHLDRLSSPRKRDGPDLSLEKRSQPSSLDGEFFSRVSSGGL